MIKQGVHVLDSRILARVTGDPCSLQKFLWVIPVLVHRSSLVTLNRSEEVPRTARPCLSLPPYAALHHPRSHSLAKVRLDAWPKAVPFILNCFTVDFGLFEGSI